MAKKNQKKTTILYIRDISVDLLEDLKTLTGEKSGSKIAIKCCKEHKQLLEITKRQALIIKGLETSLREIRIALDKKKVAEKEIDKFLRGREV